MKLVYGIIKILDAKWSTVNTLLIGLVQRTH